MPKKPMKLLVYRDGVDFEIPAGVLAARGPMQPVHLLRDLDAQGNARDGSFVRVSDPDEADFIVFPYVLDQFISEKRTLYVHFFLRGLPHFLTHEHKHALFNFQDRGQPLLTSALIVTDDPRRSNAADPFVSCYPHFPAPHVVRAAPAFDFSRIRYDVCFVGTLSDPVRVEMIRSVQAQKELKSFLSHPDTLDWSDPNTSYLHMQDADKRRALEDLYVNNAAKSWAMLCPRGMGSSSIRFYEAMCLGRIPVHVSDEYVFPLEGAIDYSRFCIDVRQSDVPVLGRLLASWFRKKGPEELEALCRLSRATWEEHFQEAHAQGLAVEILRRHLAVRPEPEAPRYTQVPEALADAPARVVSTDPERYAALEIDNRNVWLNKGFRLSKSKLDPSGAMTECNGVSGYLPQQDIQFLLNVAAGLPRGGTLVEIGSWMGLSGITMCNALYARRNLDARIFCVDTWLGSAEHQDYDFIKRDEMYQKYLENISQADAEPLMRPVRAPSLEAAARFRDGSIDILFIDGDHSFEGCLADMLAWWPKVRPGGLVIGHDYYVHPDNGVFQAARRFEELTGIAVGGVEGLRMFHYRRPA